MLNPALKNTGLLITIMKPSPSSVWKKTATLEGHLFSQVTRLFPLLSFLISY